MDGTESQKDSLQKSGQASTDKQETSQSQAKTYTEEEVNKRVSDTLAAKGRDAKTLSDREAALNTREEAIKAKEAEIEQAELADAKSDPDKMAAYNAKKARKQQETDLKAEREAIKKEREELDRDKADHEAELTAARETQREITIWEVATAKNVDPMKLKNLSTKFNIEGKEKLEELAEEIASGKPGETTKETHVDSGVTSGASKSPKGTAALAEFFRENK